MEDSCDKALYSELVSCDGLGDGYDANEERRK